MRTKLDCALCRYVVSSRRYASIAGPLPAAARRSPPKQKFLPAPVSTTARTAGLRAHVSAAAMRSIPTSRLSALPLSGRLMVTTATAPRDSTSTVVADMACSSLVRRDGDPEAGQPLGEFHLTGKARAIRIVVRQLRQQLFLIRHGRRQLVGP